MSTKSKILQTPRTKLETIVKNSISYAGILRKLGYSAINGANYKTLKVTLKNLDINTSHMLGQGHLKGKTHNWTKKRPLCEILVKNSDYNSTTNLKKRLLKEELLKPECYSSDCPLKGIKLKRPLVEYLHLDHIDGDNVNNLHTNLRLLCPLCHMDTPTYAGKNNKKKITVKSKKDKTKKKIKQFYCINCGIVVSKKATRCFKCYKQKDKHKILWPKLDVLISEIKTTSINATATKYGAAFNSLKKYLKKSGVDYSSLTR